MVLGGPMRSNGNRHRLSVVGELSEGPQEHRHWWISGRLAPLDCIHSVCVIIMKYLRQPTFGHHLDWLLRRVVCRTGEHVQREDPMGSQEAKELMDPKLGLSLWPTGNSSHRGYGPQASWFSYYAHLLHIIIGLHSALLLSFVFAFSA